MPVQQQPPPQPAGPPHTVSLYIGVEAPPEWNLARRIKGEGVHASCSLRAACRGACRVPAHAAAARVSDNGAQSITAACT